jgi:hypothetical protein
MKFKINLFEHLAQCDNNVLAALVGANTVSVWSDGASKHFKQGRMITFVCREWISNAIVDYNFFASYHGKGGVFCCCLLLLCC